MSCRGEHCLYQKDSGEPLKGCKQRNDMIKLTFWKQNYGCCLKNRLEMASRDAGRLFRKLLQSFRWARIVSGWFPEIFKVHCWRLLLTRLSSCFLRCPFSFDGPKPFVDLPCHYLIVVFPSTFLTSLGAQWDWEKVNEIGGPLCR